MPEPKDLVAKAIQVQALIESDNSEFDYQLAAIAQEKTVTGQFVRDVLSSVDLSEVERVRVLVAGLRALDGRDDLELA